MSGSTLLTQPTKIYATSEERKQRNRQAQAAFRERRTEYIKQLESTIKVHEEALQSLNQSHRTAADECLMLRYKNSLLERILLEKGTMRPCLRTITPRLTCRRNRRASRTTGKDRQPRPRSYPRTSRRDTTHTTHSKIRSQQALAESKIPIGDTQAP